MIAAPGYVLHSQRFTGPYPYSNHDRIFDLLPSTIRHRGLSVVTALAQHLPIGSIPEQTDVSFVRSDVVDNRGHFRNSFPVALDAQRIGSQELFPRSTPLGTIAPYSCRSTQLIHFALYLNPVPFTSAVTFIHKRSASRMAAWVFRSVWRISFPMKPLRRADASRRDLFRSTRRCREYRRRWLAVRIG
jgi:hypothetical protein